MSESTGTVRLHRVLRAPGQRYCHASVDRRFLLAQLFEPELSDSP